MDKHILQWLHDELESHGNPNQPIMDWDELDKLWQTIEKETMIKLK